MSEQTLPTSRLAFQAFETEEKKTQERKKYLLYLIEEYLREEGYWDSARALATEAKLNDSFVVCDNIDLATILREYESYYQIKFGKAPKLCRRRDPSDQPKQQAANPKLARKITKTRALPASTSPSATATASQPSFGLDMTVVSLNAGDSVAQTAANGSEKVRPTSPVIAKPLSGFYGASIELREMVELISKDIVQRPACRLKDVIGVTEAKRALMEGIVLPRKYPHLFRGILAPNVGILLHGPPGTGKTLLATAVAGEAAGVLLRLHASSLISKWRGDSEKLVRVLFDFARYMAPSIILLDEVDALVNQRGNRSEHEATRRMQAELLVQLDLLTASAETNESEATASDFVPPSVTVIAATNVPWELDGALLRRLGKRILVGLPDVSSREAILRSLLSPKQEIAAGLHLVADVDYKSLAQKTEGYSGSDLKLLCKEAATGATRGMLLSLAEGKRAPQNLDTVKTSDVVTILDRVRPSATYKMERFHSWQEAYGCI